METNKRFKKFLADAEYEVNKEKKTVTCSIMSKGEKIYAYSKCGPDDKFDEERGKEIAAFRVEIKQRKRDLAVTNEVIDNLKAIINSNEHSVHMGWKKRSEISKHWSNFLRLACDERRSQLENIRYCKEQLKKYK